jgi:hypothetical protein
VDDRLRLEVLDLTEMLRSEPVFGPFREWLASRGLNVANLLLAGQIDYDDGQVPGKDGMTMGVLVVPPGKVMEFEGDIHSPEGSGFSWEEIKPMDGCLRWPALQAALSIAAAEHLSFVTTVGRELAEGAETCGSTEVVINDGYEAFCRARLQDRLTPDGVAALDASEREAVRDAFSAYLEEDISQEAVDAALQRACAHWAT